MRRAEPLGPKRLVELGRRSRQELESSCARALGAEWRPLGARRTALDAKGGKDEGAATGRTAKGKRKPRSGPVTA